MARIEACGGLHRCALLLCLAQARGLVVDDVDCNECGMPFLDDENNLKPTNKHKCGNCGKTTRSGLSGVCNPLKPFVFGEDSNNSFGDLEIVALDDVVECVTKNGGTITHADITKFISDNTPSVVSSADVSTHVARCARPPKVVKNKKCVVGDVVKGRDAASAVGPISSASNYVGRLVATPERVVGDSTQKQTKNSTNIPTTVPHIEQVSYRSFKRGAEKGRYTAMYLTLVNDVEHHKHVNFTHRSSHGSLGHGDATTL